MFERQNDEILFHILFQIESDKIANLTLLFLSYYVHSFSHH